MDFSIVCQIRKYFCYFRKLKNNKLTFGEDPLKGISCGIEPFRIIVSPYCVEHKVDSLFQLVNKRDQQ